jgi:hypothetical protein
VTAEDAESARSVDAFLALCPAVVEFEDLERALAEAEATGHVTPQPERLIVISSHQALSMRQRVAWEDQELELGWGAGPQCGLVRVWTSDYSAFSNTLSNRTGVTWEERNGLFIDARRQRVGTYRSWIIERGSQRFEITSVLDAFPYAASAQGFVTVGIGLLSQTVP